jgi:hypothetical protein
LLSKLKNVSGTKCCESGSGPQIMEDAALVRYAFV